MTRKKGRKVNVVPSLMVVNSALKDFKPYLSSNEFERLMAELEHPLIPALRINPLKVNPSSALMEWQTLYGWKVKNIPFCPTGWWINESQVPISQTIDFRLGNYYIQDAASMLPVELFDFKDLDKPIILDLAASPGGKTTHLCSNSSDRGLVIGNDSSRSRLTALRLVLNAWGATGTMVTNFPGEKFGNWFPETFDRILLDAPCSMHNLRTTEARPMRSITSHERQTLSQRQSNLLFNAFQSLKVSGQIVYSTCTLASEEDEGVLDTLLKRWPHAVKVENASMRLPIPAPALASDADRHFHPEVVNAIRLWPHIYGTSGFFSALITKTDHVDTNLKEVPGRPLVNTGLIPLSLTENRDLKNMFLDAYGFDLQVLLEKQGLELWRVGRIILSLPILYLRQFSNFPVIAAGLPLGEQSVDGFIPGHDWVTRFHALFRSGRMSLAQNLVPAWLRGEDIRPVPENRYRSGFTVIVEDETGRLLGRGKLHTDRIKNLLPRRAVL